MNNKVYSISKETHENSTVFGDFFQKLNKIAVCVVMMFFITSTSFAQLKLKPLVGYGIQSMNYDYGQADIKGTGGLNVGADLFYYLNENMAVGSGVRFSTYKTTATLDNLVTSYSGTDKDGDSYDLTKTLTGVSENHTQSTIEIPVLGRYERWFGPDIILFGNTGPVFIFPGSSKTDFESGKLTASGYYEKWGLTIDEASDYGYGENDLTGSTVDHSSKMSVAWAVEWGAEYYISSRLNLSLTAFFQTGLSSCVSEEESADPLSFNGTLMESGSAKLSKLGLRFGISFDITPPERASVKSIR